MWRCDFIGELEKSTHKIHEVFNKIHEVFNAWISKQKKKKLKPVCHTRKKASLSYKEVWEKPGMEGRVSTVFFFALAQLH
jgi:hypothetical protein